MRKIIHFMSCLAVLAFMISCANGQNGGTASSENHKSEAYDNQKREYVFVETVEKQETDYKRSTYERSPIKIVATSDIEAIMIAYRNFCITEALYLKNKYKHPNPIAMRIYDDTGADITASVMKLSKADQDIMDSRAKSIRAEVFKDYSVKEPEY